MGTTGPVLLLPTAMAATAVGSDTVFNAMHRANVIRIRFHHFVCFGTENNNDLLFLVRNTDSDFCLRFFHTEGGESCVVSQ